MINKVHQMDCMEFMKDVPDKYYDLGIPDPSYGIGDCLTAPASRELHGDMTWNEEIPGEKYFKELKRICKNQIIWGANYFPGLLGGRIIHDKMDGGKQKIWDNLSEADIAYHSFGNNIKIFRYGWKGNVQGSTINWSNTGIDKRIHPTQKSVAVYLWILRKFAKSGDKIFDSHVGSGSLRIACWILDFYFEGGEMHKKYWKDQEFRFEDFISGGKESLRLEMKDLEIKLLNNFGEV